VPAGRATVAAAGIGAVAVFAAVAWARAGTWALLLTPAERSIQEAHGTWRRMFDEHGIAAHAPLLVWALALLALGIVGLPYAWIVGRALPDRGAALARPLALLLVGWLVWWLASVRLVAFTRGGIALAFAAVALGAGVLAAANRQELRRWLTARWKIVLTGEAVFWALFGATLLVRYLNPDLWHPVRGGEKPMDFAYLNAVVKSTHFPPFDPWFAGGQMNYYYFGFVLVAVLVKATAVVPAVAYNLAVPTLAGMLAGSSFSAALGLATRTEARRFRIGAGILGAVLVVVVGNLGELRVLRSALHGSVPVDWWYWNPSRVIHHLPGEPGPITEFPAFTYLYADLHAHAMALPFAMVALALAVALVRDAGNAEGLLTPPARIALLALTVGSLWATNSWDLPTYAVVVLAALGLAHWQSPKPWGATGLAKLGLTGAAFLALAYVSFLPFHLHYRSVFEGVQRWQGSRTPLADYLTVHGLFLFAIVSALVVELWTARDLNPVARELRLSLRTWDRVRRRRQLTRALVSGRSPGSRLGAVGVAAGAAAALTLAVLGEGVAALATVLATATALALAGRRRSGSPLRQLTAVLFGLGLLLTVAVEYLVVRNIDVGRTNTVFKLYLQVWLLWSLTAVAAVALVYDRLPLLPRAVRLAWRAGFVVLLAVAALYPILADRARVDDRFDTSVGATLDGAAFMRRAVLADQGTGFPLAWDADAIRWLLQHVDGSPVVAEVNTYPTLYGWGNRYAMFTGNPSIVGWDYHQRQQRPSQSELVRARIADVQTLYRTSDARLAHELLSRYDVSYVVVGPLERAMFPQGTPKWSAPSPFWTRVYTNPGVQIYRVNRVSGSR
jgi:YYY domain-containing protein